MPPAKETRYRSRENPITQKSQRPNRSSSYNDDVQNRNNGFSTTHVRTSSNIQGQGSNSWGSERVQASVAYVPSGSSYPPQESLDGQVYNNGLASWVYYSGSSYPPQESLDGQVYNNGLASWVYYSNGQVHNTDMSLNSIGQDHLNRADSGLSNLTSQVNQNGVYSWSYNSYGQDGHSGLHNLSNQVNDNGVNSKSYNMYGQKYNGMHLSFKHQVYRKGVHSKSHTRES